MKSYQVFIAINFVWTNIQLILFYIEGFSRSFFGSKDVWPPREPDLNPLQLSLIRYFVALLVMLNLNLQMLIISKQLFE